MKTAIITGITGQDGAYLAKFLITKGYKVVGLTRGYNNYSLSALEYLKIKDKVFVEECNLFDFSSVLETIKKHNPDEIYNLASQSAVGLSFKHPIDTLNANVICFLNLLEAVKIFNKSIKIFQASSTEMFGNPKELPVHENTELKPISPYGISKTAAHMLAHCYRYAENMFVYCGILSNHESFLRKDSFIIKKIIKQACEIKQGKRDKICLGNTVVKRDFGLAEQYVKAMWLLLQQSEPQDALICSGKSYSIQEILFKVFDYLQLSYNLINYDPNLMRPDEIADMYGDNSRIKTMGWDYNIDFIEAIVHLISEEMVNV